MSELSGHLRNDCHRFDSYYAAGWSPTVWSWAEAVGDDAGNVRHYHWGSTLETHLREARWAQLTALRYGPLDRKTVQHVTTNGTMRMAYRQSQVQMTEHLRTLELGSTAGGHCTALTRLVEFGPGSAELRTGSLRRGSPSEPPIRVERHRHRSCRLRREAIAPHIYRRPLVPELRKAAALLQVGDAAVTHKFPG